MPENQSTGGRDRINRSEGREETVDATHIIYASNSISASIPKNKGSQRPDVCCCSSIKRKEKLSGLEENLLPEIITQPEKHALGGF